MTLTEDLIKAALLGTQNVASGHDETSLLLLAASTRLREKAGFVAPRDHLPLHSPAPPETTVPCGQKAMRALRLMLAGIHRYSLREWLIAAVRAGQHVHEDVLPRLLLLGLNHEELRGYLLPVLGQRGYWLVGEVTNQNWNWVLETPEYPIDDLISFDQWKEAEFIKLLRSQPLAITQNDSYRELFRYRLVWTHDLTHAFLHSLNAMAAPQWSWQWWEPQFVRKITPLAYSFPLDMRAEMIRQFAEVKALHPENSRTLIENVQVIMQFRQDMVNAIEKREDL